MFYFKIKIFLKIILEFSLECMCYITPEQWDIFFSFGHFKSNWADQCTRGTFEHKISGNFKIWVNSLTKIIKFNFLGQMFMITKARVTYVAIVVFASCY